jgi:hypothetical protein
MVLRSRALLVLLRRAGTTAVAKAAPKKTATPAKPTAVWSASQVRHTFELGLSLCVCEKAR